MVPSVIGRLIRARWALCILLLAPTTAPHVPGTPGQASAAVDADIDAFMERVFERRDANWNELGNYTGSKYPNYQQKY